MMAKRCPSSNSKQGHTQIIGAQINIHLDSVLARGSGSKSDANSFEDTNGSLDINNTDGGLERPLSNPLGDLEINIHLDSVLARGSGSKDEWPLSKSPRGLERGRSTINEEEEEAGLQLEGLNLSQSDANSFEDTNGSLDPAVAGSSAELVSD
jgi:hypothetical protein